MLVAMLLRSIPRASSFIFCETWDNYALGEYAEAQAALGCALEQVEGVEGIQIVQQIQRDLYAVRFSDQFPTIFEEYYQTF